MKEFGFDFLRDHSMQREQKQRELWYGAQAALRNRRRRVPFIANPIFS